jgi:hypothetical protein
MNGAFVVAGLALASVIASLFIGPEVGLFLAIAATLLAVAVALDSPGAKDRRDARNRNQAHRR